MVHNAAKVDWREALDSKAFEKARWKANWEIGQLLLDRSGSYVLHPGIRSDLYRDVGIHLSAKGNLIFFEDLRQGLRVALGHAVEAEA